MFVLAFGADYVGDDLLGLFDAVAFDAVAEYLREHAVSIHHDFKGHPVWPALHSE
ncbi:hypothetical protein M3B96_10560 [Corynebacterium propinquum]|uniref:hypothetical protein n=1 Tax=Corynebacterium propinquum TaxID=43769 RepID=UPI00223B46FD|nr:hypothetical protein [Corynebacterium propinquum]MCT1819380.1 hypothetical protein [Corynebacterium propinquum]